MANEEHLARLKQGVKAWNQWREQYPAIEPDLIEADLAGMDLSEANLAKAHLFKAALFRASLLEANLIEADLTKADLTEAALISANLTRANLIEADLTQANLTIADFSRVDLIEANLSETNFTRTIITGADFTRARMIWTIFGDVDLSTTQGLHWINHMGPSTIGIDTLYRSAGNIPDAFLRGAGVPEEMITYMKSLVGRPFESYSCFISYSSKDQDFAGRLHADLQAKGVRCWFAAHDIQGGRKIHEQIDQAIRRYERLLLILSPTVCRVSG
jgi:hypothetical protein